MARETLRNFRSGDLNGRRGDLQVDTHWREDGVKMDVRCSKIGCGRLVGMCGTQVSIGGRDSTKQLSDYQLPKGGFWSMEFVVKNYKLIHVM